MALTTLLGTAQLALQNALAGSVDVAAGVPRVPNVVTISLRREAFLRQYPGQLVEERERFRREITEAARAYLSANGWRIGGTGSLVVDILLRDIPVECDVRLGTLDALYELRIEDDEGSRGVPVKWPQTIVGRAHDPHPRAFVPVNDRAHVFSREHLILTYADRELTLRLLGRNVTTLNGTRIGEAEEEGGGLHLRDGDVITCGRCRIIVRNL